MLLRIEIEPIEQASYLDWQWRWRQTEQRRSSSCRTGCKSRRCPSTPSRPQTACSPRWRCSPVRRAPAEWSSPGGCLGAKRATQTARARRLSWLRLSDPFLMKTEEEAENMSKDYQKEKKKGSQREISSLTDFVFKISRWQIWTFVCLWTKRSGTSNRKTEFESSFCSLSLDRKSFELLDR